MEGKKLVLILSISSLLFAFTAEGHGSQTFAGAPTSAKTVPIPGECKKICDHTKYSKLCLRTITPYLIWGKTDAASVLHMELKATEKMVEKALKSTKSVLKSAAIDQCVSMYDNTLYRIQQAVDALKAGDVGTLNAMLSAIGTNIRTCEDGFSEVGEASHHVLSTFDLKIHRLSENCLAISKLLPKA
ncbi:Pectinesterase inhibitor domain [Dillenia turbinata]|uniref:Pectinesterase inhibitor domain n=1 Tax=Dillenia turbinata TaxID=194707 RepID=A0AAN8ZE34_9MAGN